MNICYVLEMDVQIYIFGYCLTLVDNNGLVELPIIYIYILCTSNIQ